MVVQCYFMPKQCPVPEEKLDSGYCRACVDLFLGFVQAQSVKPGPVPVDQKLEVS